MYYHRSAQVRKRTSNDVQYREFHKVPDYYFLAMTLVRTTIHALVQLFPPTSTVSCQQSAL